ncbi:MAG: hypothetical protein AAGB30_06930 [Pedobacter sp.]
MGRSDAFEVLSEISELSRDGYKFLTYPAGKDVLGPKDFEYNWSREAAEEATLWIEFGRVLPTGSFALQLERSLARGFGEELVLADFSKMGLEQGDLFSDLKSMGVDGGLVARAFEDQDVPWQDVEMTRSISGMEISMRLLTVEIGGKLRIPEYAVAVPRLLGEEKIEERFAGGAALLEEEFRRTLGFGDEAGLFASVEARSALHTAGSCVDFIYYTYMENPDGLYQRGQIVSTLCQRYPAGRAVEQCLLSMHGEMKGLLYSEHQFPYTVKVDRVLEKINDGPALKEMSRQAYWDINLKKAIMEAKNLESLKNELRALGFGEHLIEQMEAKMAANEPRFIVYDKLEVGGKEMELGLHFNQSRSSEYYYFNKYDLVKETQAPLAEGEKYFVTSQRQGDEAKVSVFEMPSLAVKEFNRAMEASEEIRGAAQIYAGADLASSRELATMADGKLLEFDKEFYRALKNPAPGQTFYVEKGNGFTLDQAVNLLSGRSVFREDVLDIGKREYAAWTKLDFDAPKDRGGNYHVKTFTEGYKFDLSETLDRFDFKELQNPEWRQALEESLRNGDRATVTVDMDSKVGKVAIEAVPEFKQVNIYSMEGKSIKREDHMKKDVEQEQQVGKGRGAKKGKEEEQGLSV